MIYLKQSTAKTFRIGPFLDSTDGVTAETGLTLSQADYRLSKAGAAYAQKNDATSGAHDENGWYTCILNTTDTNTPGPLHIAVAESGALPVWVECSVVTANWFDTMFSTDVLNADVTQIGGDAQSATDLKDFADAGYDPATNKVQGVVLTDTATDVTNEVSADVTKISGDATSADNLELDYDGTGYAKANSTIGTCTTNTDAITVAGILTTQMTEAYAADGAAPTLAQALMLIQQSVTEFANSGTTKTVKKVDGSTTAATFTYDDADSPTSITRAT